MANEKLVKEAVEFFRKNPYWAKALDDAPSDLSRRHLELEFYASMYDVDDYVDEMKDIEEEMGIEDWKYLIQFAGNNPGRRKYTRAIERLS